MKRKVNKVGQNTLTVSLPSAWAKKNSIKAGDELEVNEEGKSLVIGAELKEKHKRIKIRLDSSFEGHVKAIIRNLYIHGYEKIEIIYNQESDYLIVSDVLEGLVGIEIINENKKGCIIESISEIRYEQYLTFLNKQFQIIMTLEDYLTEAMTNGANDTDHRIIKSLNKESSKYASLCRRVLTKNQLMNNDDALVVFTFINLMHMIARNHVNTYIYIYENKIKVGKIELELMNETKKMFKELYNIYLKKESNEMNIKEKRKDILTKRLPKLFNPKNNGMVIHYLAEVIRIIGTAAPKLILLNNFLSENISKELSGY